MPTASQSKILTKISKMDSSSSTQVSARSLALQRATEVASSPVYVPPVPKVFSFNKKEMDLRKLRGGDGTEGIDRTFFPEMVSMAQLMAKPGTSAEELSADEIMQRLHELGWRRQGAFDRMEEKRKREQEKQREEAERLAKQREVLDLVNDPLLRRVKERNQNMPKYVRAPDSRPLAVCFDYKGPSLAHSTVKLKLDELLAEMDDTAIKLSTVEYEPRDIHVKGQLVPNRWILNMETQFAAAQISGQSLKIGRQEVELKLYDDVIAMEYKNHTRQSNFMKQFNI